MQNNMSIFLFIFVTNGLQWTSRNPESLGEIGFPDLSKLSVHLKMSSRLASDLTEDIPNTASL
jgi:hypothetical protein